MTVRTRNGGIAAAGLLAVVAAWSPVVAQDTAASDVAVVAEEDTSWKEKSVRKLRREYRDAEENFYGAFNNVNTDDEFDIDCKTAAPLGSRKRERRCQAEFLWEYEEELAEETYRQSSTGTPAGTTTSAATLQRKQNELRAEMTAAISDYPAVAAAFAELGRTKRNYELKLAED